MKEFLLGERYPSRVAATFDNADSARRAADSLLHEADLSVEQVRVIDPQDPLIGHKLEPESRGVGRTLVRSHLFLGLLGLVTGLAVVASLLASGLAFAVSQPVMTGVSLGAFGAILGLLAGGVISVRPDHRRLNLMARDATRKGSWMVVALTARRSQRERARGVLARRSDEVMHTL